MRIVLGVPMRNEMDKGHLHMQLENALRIGYDAIVILDDGSTDDTLKVLKGYENKYESIHVFKNERNSVLSRGNNRWMVLTEHCCEFEPDWVNVRSTDQLYSCACFKDGQDLLRKRLEKFMDKEVHRIALPEIHLWRSDWWYRTDREWGAAARGGCVSHIWKFNINYAFKNDKYTKAGMHVGHHLPNYLGVDKIINFGINGEKEDPFPIVILHYGHSSHEKLEMKFEWMMKAVLAVRERAVAMPPPEKMPRPGNWCSFCGYKSAYEIGIKFKKVNQNWFETSVPDIPKPKIKSLYNSIKKYNEQRAEEYKKLFNTNFGD